MNITDIKELMAQFDASSLRDFSYKVEGVELTFSKNDGPRAVVPAPLETVEPAVTTTFVDETETPVALTAEPSLLAEGDVVESPLVGVAYLSPAPDKPAFVSVGDTVKKGQTLLIIEAMKVMNEIPAPKDGIVTEILVANEEVVDFGKGLVRIK